MADWDESSPADNDIVSQYPANERAARLAGKTNFGVDHHEANDANVGKHEVVQVMDNAGDPTITAGEVGIWNNGGKLNTRVGAAAVSRVINLVSGTKMLFFQAAAPTGWTQDVAANDRVLRVVSGAGGGTGGSWTLSGVTVNNHTLTVSQIPAHDHGTNTGVGGGHNHTTGSGGSHAHSGTASSAGSHYHLMFDNVVSSGDLDSVASPAYRGSKTSREYEIAGASGAPVRGRTETTGAHTHSLSINSDGAHTHSVSTVSDHTHSIASEGGGAAHNHGLTSDGTWRPSYVDVIAATLD